jgi:hypothetical protein
MKTFKDITWKQHQLGKGNIQGLLKLDNGIELSIVAGTGMYSAGTKVEDVSSFEVAIIDENLPEDEQEWEVSGWQSRKDISKLMIENS